MGIIKKELTISGDKGEKNIEALFDTGASASLVKKDVCEKIATVLCSPYPFVFTLGNNSKITIKNTTTLFVDLKGYKLAHIFLVYEDLPYELIIGADFLQRWKIKLDMEKEEFIIDEEALRMILVNFEGSNPLYTEGG